LKSRSLFLAIGEVLVAEMLVVEDDRDILSLLTLRLAGAGFGVVPEADGDRGVVAAFERRPAVVILGWPSGGSGGPKFCQRLKSEADTAGVRVLVLSARGTERDREAALAAGADCFLSASRSPSTTS
jgi:two-component system phosphate regulon response regulator PhoB